MEGSLEHLSTEEERRLIRRVVAGHKNDYQILVLSYQSRLFAVIVRMVGNETVAKDLVQEAFIKAFVKLETFRFESGFHTWLTRIAINITSSYLNSSQHKRLLKTVSLDKEYSGMPLQEDHYDRFDDQAIKRLEEVTRKLTPKLRSVFVLCGLEQRSYQDVASILQVPVGTVRSRLNRARVQVRKLYFEE